MKQRRRRNHIRPINSNIGILESVEEVREQVHNHFKLKFSKTEMSRPVLDGIFFKGLDYFEIDSLEVPFSKEEINEVVWSCDGLKSPGLDGYTFHFIKKCWFFIKDDFVKCLEDFYTGAFFLSKAIISSFFTLVSKSYNPLGLEDYRPICLVVVFIKLSLNFWLID